MFNQTFFLSQNYFIIFSFQFNDEAKLMNFHSKLQDVIEDQVHAVISDIFVNAVIEYF